MGDSARRVRGLLRARGYDSHIYALTIDDDLRGEIRAFWEPAARQGDITILHFAIASPMSDALASLPKGRVLQYHNITPARFFAGYDAGIVALVTRGRQELAGLARRVDLALGDSEVQPAGTRDPRVPQDRRVSDRGEHGTFDRGARRARRSNGCSVTG